MEKTPRTTRSPESPLARTEKANINFPVLASLKIEATNDDESIYLVSSDGLFKSEKISQIKPPSQPGRKGSALGKLSSSKTSITRINNYPENIEVVVDFVYDHLANSLCASYYRRSLCNCKVQTLHSPNEMMDLLLVEDDARIGFFTETNK